MDLLKLALNEHHDGQVLEVALHAPKANILDAAMMAELRTVLAAERAPSKRKAIVLGGSGAHFCYGASVPEHEASQVAPRFARGVRQYLRRTPMTTPWMFSRSWSTNMGLSRAFAGCSRTWSPSGWPRRQRPKPR